MYQYKVRFNNGTAHKVTAENLDQAHTRIVRYMTANGVTGCSIYCPNGVTRTVKHTGDWHPRHNGFLFN